MKKRKVTKPYEQMSGAELALEQMRLLDDISFRLSRMLKTLDSVVLRAKGKPR